MKQNKQAGFGIIEVVLVVAILAVAVLVGLRFYESQNAVTKTQNTTSSNAATAKPNTLPDGWVEYTSDKLGLSFAYPRGWGDVKMSENEADLPHDGVRYRLTFTGNDTFKMAAKTSDFKYTGQWGGEPYISGFTDYEKQKSDLLKFTQNLQGYSGKTYKTTDNYITYSTASLIDNDFIVGGIHKADKVAGLQYAFVLPIGSYNLSEEALAKISKQEVGADKYISQQQIDEINQISESIKLIY